MSKHLLSLSVMPLNIAIAIGLSACGGGGSSSGGGSTVNTDPTKSPTVVTQTGDWLVYENVVTPSIPSGQASSSSTITRYMTNADASGYSRTDFATNGQKTFRTFNSDGQQSNFERAVLAGATNDTKCTYTPLLRTQVPYGSAAGFSITYPQVTEACVGGFTGTTKYDNSAAAVGAEDITIAGLGTFKAYKNTYTQKSTGATTTTTSTSTNWADASNGRTLRTETSTSVINNTTQAITSASTSTFTLKARSVNGETPIGSAVARFAGKWNFSVVIPEAGTALCAGLTLSPSGALTGTCTITVNGTSATLTATGSVGADGKFNATVTSPGEEAVTFNGNLSVSGTGSGTWADSAASSTWTAQHQ